MFSIENKRKVLKKKFIDTYPMINQILKISQIILGVIDLFYQR